MRSIALQQSQISFYGQKIGSFAEPLPIRKKMRTWPHWLCIFLLLMPPQAYSDTLHISVDPNAAENQKPLLTAVGRDIPLINISTPNSAGVSSNLFSQFDVPPQGLIFNNTMQTTDAMTELAGRVETNPNLKEKTANLIINQVTGGEISRVFGFLEVAGDRASVIVANPSGITCDNCGFINVPHATLTTGVPLLSSAGSLEGYRVEGGTISFEGKGLNTKVADYTDILARAIKINAHIHGGKNLRVVTGRNSITQTADQSLTPTPLEKDENKPEFALDVAALGGMYAGKIHMVGTEAGVGVRNAGMISSSSDDFVLTADGNIENTHTIQSQRNLEITSTSGKITNSHVIQAKQNLELKASGDLISNTHGTLSAHNGQVSLLGRNIINDKALIHSAGDISLKASEWIRNTNSTKDQGLKSLKTLTLTADQGVENTNGHIVSAQLLTLHTPTLLSKNGSLESRDHDVILSGNILDLNNGILFGKNKVTLSFAENITAQSAKIHSHGAVEISAKTLDISETKTESKDQGILGNSLLIKATHLLSVRGFMAATEDFRAYIAGKFTHQDSRLEGKTVEIKDPNTTPGKRILEIDNTGGTLFAAHTMMIEGEKLTNKGLLLSQGDISITLSNGSPKPVLLENKGFSGFKFNMNPTEMLAANNSGRFINHGQIQANKHLNITSKSAENQSAGTLVGLEAFTINAQNSLSNYGLIDGGKGFIDTGSLTNSGTGAIYGDALSLKTSFLTNTEHNGKAGAIATRQGDMHIATSHLKNEKGALLYSSGHLFIGNILDANSHAQGRSSTIVNSGSRIEAAGNLTLRANSLSNKNDRLRYEVRTEETFGPKEHLWQDKGWCTYNARCEHSTYTRSQKSLLLDSNPAQILAGQRIVLGVTTGENYSSHIVGGSGVTYEGVTLKNTSPHVVLTQTHGMRTYGRSDHQTWDWKYAWVDHGNKHRWTERPHAPTVTSHTVEVLIPSLSSTPGSHASTIATSEVTGDVFNTQSLAGPSTSLAAPVLPSLQMATLHEVSHSLQGSQSTIRTADFSPEIPKASLFIPHPEPTATYLIETDPRFTQRTVSISSDQQLVQLGVDPKTAPKRVGDGFYEQMLVRDQMVKLTGYRYRSNYASDSDQYAALLSAGADFAKTHNLHIGMPPTREQMSQVTADMAVLVKRTVRMNNGTTHEVLVPQIYVVSKPKDLHGNQALISGNQVQISTQGDVTHSGGAIAGRQGTDIASQNSVNTARIGDGGETKLQAQNDIVNTGGTIQGQSVTITAGRDFISTTTTQSNERHVESQDGQSSSSTKTINIDGQASIKATGSDGSLSISTGRDTHLTGTQIENQGAGTTTVNAGQNVIADTAQTHDERSRSSSSEKKSWFGTTSVSERAHTVQTHSHGTEISGGGSITISSGGDSTFKNTQITSGGETRLQSQGTINFQTDTTAAGSQNARSNTGIFWQESKTQSQYDETAQSTQITSSTAPTITAGGGINAEYVVPEDNTSGSRTQILTTELTDDALQKALGGRFDVTWIPVPEAHQTSSTKQQGLTQTGAALVAIGVTALTFATGGTAAGALGITNGVGAASINAGATSLGTQLAINTINSDGDVGKALGDVSLKQVATSAATAGITQGLINVVSPAVITRVDQNIQAGAGASTKATDLGITQSGSMTQAAGFGERLPGHLIQTGTNVGASAVLSGGDSTAMANAALGSAAGALGTEASLQLGNAYHSGQMNTVVHKVLHGAVGCGTGALAGGSCAAGAAGAVVGEMAGEVYVNTQTGGSKTSNQIAKEAGDIGRIAGGLGGLAAGGDVTTGANTGGVAAENNAVGTILDAAQVAQDVVKIGKGYATDDLALVKEGLTDLALDAAALAAPGVPAGLQKIGRAAKQGAEAVGQKLGSGAGKEASEKISTKVDASLDNAKPSGSLSAEEANNNPKYNPDYQPPYAPGTRARDIILDKDRTFVRVHQEGQPGSTWMMRPEEIQGLTPQQIKDKFALPSTPTHISEVKVPAGTKVRIGTAAPQDGWGKGGGTQYEMERVLDKQFYNDKGPISEYLKTLGKKP